MGLDNAGGDGGGEGWEKVVDGVKGVLIYERGVDFRNGKVLLRQCAMVTLV